MCNDHFCCTAFVDVNNVLILNDKKLI